jgi:hypothetical protein
MLTERRLLEPIAPELQAQASASLWASLAALDRFRARFDSAPVELTNPILLGSLLVPMGHAVRTLSPPPDASGKEPRLALGLLSLPRRDIERLRQILSLQRRLTDTSLSPRARRALMHRGPFRDALTWLEIHGGAPDVLEHWRGFIEAATAAEDADGNADSLPPRRKRRRRRRGFKRPAT